MDIEKPEKKMKKVTFTLPEQLYIDYKKALLDMRTTPTADLRRHMQGVVEKAKDGKAGE